MWLNVAFKAIFYHFSSQSIKFSNLQVWHEMEAKLVGEFTEDQSEREKSFQAKMKRFQSVCRDLISAHKTAREGGPGAGPRGCLHPRGASLGPAAPLLPREARG